VRFVEEEHELGLVDIADLRQLVIEAREQPHHERREQRRLVLHVRELERAHQALAVALLHQVLELELGLAEECQRALLLQLHHLAEQHADRGLGHPAVVLELIGALPRQELEHGAQIGEVEQQQPAVVAELEHQRKHARLGLVETQHLGEEQRAERGHRRAELGAALAGEAEILDRKARAAPREARVLARWATRSLDSPGVARPERSPFTSATKTGTPRVESCSARSWSVLVLPVPVAPAMSPWRLIMERGSVISGSARHSPSCTGAPMTIADACEGNAARAALTSLGSMVSSGMCSRV
jgi:hypothetical protein